LSHHLKLPFSVVTYIQGHPLFVGYNITVILAQTGRYILALWKCAVRKTSNYRKMWISELQV